MNDTCRKGLLLLVLVGLTGCTAYFQDPDRGTVSSVLLYVGDRGRDLADVVHFSVAAGPGLGAQVRVTDVFAPSIGFLSQTIRLGHEAHGRSMWSERELYFPTVAFAPAPDPGHKLMAKPATLSYSRSTGLKAQSTRIAISRWGRTKRYERSLQPDTDQSWQETKATAGEMSKLEIGGVLGILGARVALSPVELFDFLFGFVGVDLARDDTPTREAKVAHRKKAQEYADKALSYLLKGQPDAAEMACDLAKFHDPSLAKIYRHLGMAYFEKANLSKAIRCFKKALEHDPTSGWTYNSLARAYGQRGEYEAAVATCIKGLRADRTGRYRCELHEALGVGYYMLGDYDKAEGAFRAALWAYVEPEWAADVRFSRATAHYMLGSIAAREGRPENALMALEEAFKIAPSLAKSAPEDRKLRPLAKNPKFDALVKKYLEE